MNIKPLDENLIKEVINTPGTRLPRHKPGGMFLKGPIPLNWLSPAALLPGKTLSVGIAIWFMAGIKKNNTIRLTGKTMIQFGVKRKAGYRALQRLEQAGLISVKRGIGRCPVVTILSGNPETNPSGEVK